MKDLDRWLREHLLETLISLGFAWAVNLGVLLAHLL
jgi:hypothetical protein